MIGKNTLLVLSKLINGVEKLEKFMSNLFKSKFLLGVMVVAVMFVASFAVSANKASADCSITMTLKLGSHGAEVMCLQTALGGLTADGSFGPKTKAAVMSFQSKGGLVADGVFGPLSRALWMSNQGNSMNFPSGCTSSAGFSLTTGAPCYAITSFPPGCNSNSGFSSTTGASCSGSMSYPAGCSSALGFSPTTGASCATGVSASFPAGCTSSLGFSPTTGASCSTGVSASTGTNGYLTDFASDSTNRVTTVYESETDKVVAGIRGTARLSSQSVDRVRVTFRNANTTTASANLAKYITSASLWQGTTKLATLAVTDASRATSDDTYTFNFSSLKAPVAKDAIGRFYVSVTANGSLDSTDAATASWTVSFVAAGISASSPDGSYDTYPTTAVTQTGLAFKKFSSSGLKAEVSLAASNPVATVVAVNNTVATNGVTVLKFKIKATNSSLTLRKVPIQITLAPQTAANDVVNVVNTIKLMRGANTVDTLDGSSGTQFTAGSASTPAGAACANAGGTADDFCSFQFINLSNPDNTIAVGDTAEFSVVVDLKAQSNYTVGATVTAALANADVLLAANFSAQDSNGDQLTNNNSAIRVGSAVGNVMTLRVNGLNLTMGTPTITTFVRGGNTNPTDVVRATYVIPVTATAFGQTLYIGELGQYVAAATGTGASASAVSFGIQKASAPTTTVNAGNLDTNVSVTASAFTCSSAIEGTVGAYRFDSGSSGNCTLTVTLNNASGNAAAATESYRVQLNDVRFFTSNDLTTGPANQTLLPTNSYQTGYATGVSKS